MHKNNDIFITILWVVLGFALIGTFFGMGYILGKNLPEVKTAEPIEISIESDDPFLGDVDAPVTIVEFSDYECPFCARHYEQSHNQLIQEYVETGKVRLVYKDFPLSFHENAVTAAIAAECAYDQGSNEMYFSMHDIIFEKQIELSLAPSRDNLLSWATEIEGLNVDLLESCIDNNETIERVNRDVQQATNVGVSATPSFFINGVLLEGAQPYAVIKSRIDAELAK